jgi:prophage regulatory protein
MEERTGHQDAEVAVHSGHLGHERMLRLPEVLSAIGMSRAWLYDAVSKGTFPAPVRLGKRAIGWREADIVAWQGGLQPTRIV